MNQVKFDAEVKELTKILRDEIKPSDGSTADSWLKVLHGAYVQRFLSDNNRIWITASIFVPLSLAALATVATLKDPQPYKLFILAGSSTGLLGFWLNIANHHRCFQDKSFAKIVAIEKHIGLQNNLFHTPRIQTAKPPLFSVKKARWCLFWGVVASWLLIFSLSCMGVIKGETSQVPKQVMNMEKK